MVKTVPRAPTRPTFRAKVSGRHTITLPAELVRQLGLAVGDEVELTPYGQHAMLRKTPAEPEPELKGLLADYFTDRDDIQRFVDEERAGWEEREKLWS